MRVVDLSHPVSADMPLWPGDPAPELITVADHGTDGYFIQSWTLGEHSGTHWVSARTFDPAGRPAEEYSAAELVRPGVVITIAGLGPDGCLDVAGVLDFEARNGRIPSGAVVVLDTGRHRNWSDPSAFLGVADDGALHWPGIGVEATTFLLRERGVAGLATDAHGIDPGSDDSLAASRAVAAAGGFLVECLAGLDRLPPTGWTLVVGGVAAVGGSGGPARVLALVPTGGLAADGSE